MAIVDPMSLGRDAVGYVNGVEIEMCVIEAALRK